MYSIEETKTEVNFFLNNHTFTAESITVKREVDDDFDYRKTANEVYPDLDQKSIIKRHGDDVKSEEEDYINRQYSINQEEVNIKSEDDEAQPNSGLKNYKVSHKSKDHIRSYKCPDCPFQSKYKCSLKKHSIRHGKPDEIVWHHCTECPYKTDRKSNLKKHAVVHKTTRKVKIFKCAHCVYETSWRPNLTKHLPVHHGDNVPCPEPECPYNTHNERNLKHRNDQYFKCTQCPYRTLRKDYLDKHIQTYANQCGQRFMCEKCPYKTNRNFRLREHEFVHHPPHREHGKWVQGLFYSFETLQNYLFKRHERDNSPRWYKCSECPYKSIRKSNFQTHAKNHKIAYHTDRFQCPDCSYRTFQMESLEEHRQLHTGVVEWFRCLHCPLKTNRKASLALHMRSHGQARQSTLT